MRARSKEQADFEPLMTTDEAGQALTVGKDTLRRLAADGRLVPVRVGRRALRYRRSDVVALLRGRQS